MYDEIIYDVTDPVATITLNRPHAMNAWTGTIERELEDALGRAAADRAVVGIVITGAGRAFCAGADMNTLTDLSSGDSSREERNASASGDSGGRADAATREANAGDFDGRFPRMLLVEKPIIAAVNGAVAGMAYPMSLSCDLRVVGPDALFVTAFAQRGLIAEWGLSWMLPKLVGPAVALDLLFSSRRVGAAEALQLGLANYAVDTNEELLPFCNDYIEKLARSSSPASMAIMKRQVYEHMHKGLGHAEAEAKRLMVESFDRPDFKEGVQSFVQKRDPQFPRVPLS